jgi:hypothetical protein
MKKARIFLLVLLVPVLLQVSCKKDDPPAPPPYKAPTSASMGDVVTIPAGLEAKAAVDGEYGASFAVTYMELANALSGYSSLFTVPDNAQIQSKKSGSTVYYWSYGGFSYWMTYAVLADKYTWKYEYEFPDHPRFTYISAEEAKSGKNGNWAIYNMDFPTQDLWSYDWSINSSNSFIASLVMYDGSSSQSSFDVVANADHSGSFKYYITAALYADILWNADGSGTYTFYGDMSSYSGSWTAK